MWQQFISKNIFKDVCYSICVCGTEIFSLYALVLHNFTKMYIIIYIYILYIQFINKMWEKFIVYGLPGEYLFTGVGLQVCTPS